MEEQRNGYAPDARADSSVSEIIHRAEAMGIHPERITLALGVPLPPVAVPDLPEIAAD